MPSTTATRSRRHYAEKRLRLSATAARAAPTRGTFATADTRSSSGCATARLRGTPRPKTASHTTRSRPRSRRADIVMMLAPDEEQPAIFCASVAPNLRPGAYLAFAHGFGIHFGTIAAAGARQRLHGRAEGAGPARAQRIRGGPRRAVPDRHRARSGGRHARRRAGVRERDRRRTSRHARDEFQGRDRDRSLRRTGGALRRPDARS